MVCPAAGQRSPASITAALRVPQLRQELVVEQAMRAEPLTLLGVLDAICDSVINGWWPHPAAGTAASAGVTDPARPAPAARHRRIAGRHTPRPFT